MPSLPFPYLSHILLTSPSLPTTYSCLTALAFPLLPYLSYSLALLTLAFLPRSSLSPISLPHDLLQTPYVVVLTSRNKTYFPFLPAMISNATDGLGVPVANK